jgi:hypothetical protein
MVIQGAFRMERSAALGAKVVGGKGSGKGKAGRADGVSRKFNQADATNATVVRERKRKGTRSGSCDYDMRRRVSSSRRRAQRPH